ncbi:MAG TPA: NUDIX domain-containing protein, partial [Allosphingosinicella sp.]
MTAHLYRPAAGVMLLNRESLVFVAQRRDSTLEAWQMPQGGLDEGEDAEAGALRE